MTNKRFFTLFISTFFFSLLGLAQVQNRMDRSRFNIGAYHLQPYAATEAHVRDVANCGIDFITCMRNDRKLLDLFAKYHVGAIVNDVVPGWFGGSGKNAGTLKTRNPLKVYETKARRFSDHPAVWGIDIGDEPSALDFPYYGQVYEQVKRLFPHQFPYLNLYPNYASVVTNTDAETISQLGTRTYAEYIDQYCKHVPADYLCYDFYLYTSNKKKVPRAYENLLVVADACTKTNRSMWIVLQANGYTETSWTS